MTGGFTYIDGTLHADGVALERIAAEVGTPFYCYSATALRDRFTALQSAFDGLDLLIAYGMKANSNQAVLKLLADIGSGADVVSLGELERAVRAGIPPERIVFAGVAKTDAEMRRGLELGIHCFNLESEPEMRRLSRIAAEMGRTAPVSVRINPDVDAKTHAKISTGKAENKFGIPIERARTVYAEISGLPGLRAVGVDMHIGSQMTDLSPCADAFALMAELVADLRADGHDIAHVDLGGGLGIAYEQAAPEPDIAAYAGLVRRHIAPLGLRIILEPGRWIAGNAGVLVTRVEYVKDGADRRFLIVDAGMNDLIRPTLYEAHHEVRAVTETLNGHSGHRGDVVGPICESGDYLGRNRDLPGVGEGDLLAVMSAGAYGAVMAGTYNSRPLVPEILVDGPRHATIRPRQTLDDLIGKDRVPDWL